MKVCICERDLDSTDMNLRIVDTEKLQEIANSKDHEDKELAQEWLDALNMIYEHFKEKGNYFGVEYKRPSSYSPDDAKVSGKECPVKIDFYSEVFC